MVVLNKGADLSQSDILAAIKDRLAKFKQPKAVLFTDAFPRNALGKVQKNLLREKHKGLYETG